VAAPADFRVPTLPRGKTLPGPQRGSSATGRTMSLAAEKRAPEAGARCSNRSGLRSALHRSQRHRGPCSSLGARECFASRECWDPKIRRGRHYSHDRHANLRPAPRRRIALKPVGGAPAPKRYTQHASQKTNCITNAHVQMGKSMSCACELLHHL